MQIPPSVRVLVSVAFVGWGFWAASSLPYFDLGDSATFFGALAFKVTSLLLAVLTLLLRNDVVFRKGWLWWTMRHLARHVMIIGDTGSGKTLGGVNFILRQYLMHVPRGGAFIVGTKGDEAPQVLKLCQNLNRSADFKCLAVKPDNAVPDWQPTERLNFVSDRSLPWTTHAKAIVDTASANTEGHQSSFFKPAAQEGIAYGLTLLEILGRPVNLRSLRDLYNSEDKLHEALRAFKEVAMGRDNPDDQRLVEYFKREFTDAKGKDQSAGLAGTIALYLAPFQSSDIAQVFCSDKPNTMAIADFDNGMVVATAIPQRFYAERQFIHTYLKTLVYYHALRRLDKTFLAKRFMNPIGCFIDEYADVVTASEDGMADHKVVDRIRSGKVFVVAAMQSELSPDPKIKEARRKVLMKQFRTRFYFRVPDEEDAKAAADFIGKKTLKRRTRASRGMLDFHNTVMQEEVHRVKTDKFINLRDFEAFVIHPTPQIIGPRYRRVRMPPIEPDGRIAAWYGFGRWAAKAKSLMS